MIKNLCIALALTVLSFPAFADETMNLFPKGRSAYQEDFDRAAQTYQERAQSYVDDMYMYGGERRRDSETSLLSHEDLEGIESAPDSIFSDPSSSQLLSEDMEASSEPPAAPE